MHRARSTSSLGRFTAAIVTVWLFLSSWLGVVPSAQTQNALSNTAVEASSGRSWDTTLLNNEEASGWLSIEIAVLIDNRPETLSGEYWPARPAVTYPLKYRSLLVADELERLSESYPFSEIRRNANGTMTIAIPEPTAFIESDKQTQLQRARQRVAFDEARMQAQQASSEDTQVQPPSHSPYAVPLESLTTADELTRPAPDNLSAYQSPTAALDTATQQSLTASPETANTLVLATGEKPLSPPLAVATPTEPPPLPTAFVQRPLSMLDSGLRELRRTSADNVAVSAAWLQPPDARNLPIIMDESGDLPNWPPLQGFVELRRGDTIRLGVNFWLNTSGEYLPDNFYATAPPKGPARIHYVDSRNDQPLTSLEVTNRQALLARYKQERPIMQRALLERLNTLAAEEQLKIPTEFAISANAEQPQLTTHSTGTLSLPSSDTHTADDGQERASVDLILAAFPTPLDTLPLEAIKDPKSEIEGQGPNENDSSTLAQWPYRHLIHMADTRVIPEGTVRYFDHPAIQILAAYRELSWGEVYQQGIAEFEANASTTETNSDDILDLPHIAPPATMVLPPALMETR